MLNKTMYKGKTNSPTTQLSEAINSIDTVIKVSNPNVFPEGPNIATIGTDSDAETILYATKTSEGLSGVTRGLEGTAKNWGVGELIARNFTAKDHNDLIENVEFLAENQEETSTQLAQMTSHIVLASRDVSLQGEQIISLLPDRTPSKVTVFGAVGGAIQSSWGTITDNAQRCIAQIENGNMTSITSLVYFRNSTNTATAMGIIEDGQLKLNWSKVGSPTGVMNFMIVADYFGGD